MTTSGVTATSLLLPEGSALRVAAGMVNVFVAEHTGGQTGAWVHLVTLVAPAVALGESVPGAVLIASALPGAEVAVVAASSLTAQQAAAAARPGSGAAQALDRARESVERKAEADLLSDEHDTWLVSGALADLADAVPGHADASVNESPQVRAVRRLARLVGLPADPVRLRGAVADARVSGRDLVAALAAACDASVRRLVLPPDWWRLRGPALLVTDRRTGDVLVAQPGRRAYQVWDPATGREHPVDERLAASIAPTAMVFQPLLDPNRPARLRDLARMGTRGSGRTAAVVLVATAAIGLIAAVVPVVSGRLTTAVADNTGVSLPVVAGALLIVVAASMAVSAVRMFALLRLRTQFTSTAAAAVWDRQLRLSMNWHKQRTQGERAMDATAVDIATANAPDSAITALLDTSAILGAVLGAFVVNAWVAVAIVGILLVRGVAEGIIGRRQVAMAARDVELEGESPTLEILTGVTRLRASGALRRAYARWVAFTAEGVQLSVRRGRLQTVQSALSALWPSLGLALLLGVIAVTAGTAADTQSLGVLVTAQTALVAANSALVAAVASTSAAFSARAILRRTEPILQALPESAGGGEVAPLAGRIDLRGIVYRYAPDLPPIFEGLNLQIEPGEHLAIVGPSGTGKTTLLRLVLGLDDPEAGLVAFDGKDLTGLDRSAVRRQIGAVMQSSALLPGSIRDNVDLGRGLSATAVWQALDQAAVADDVREMPMGLNTVVVEGGAGISGGQRQRILLARALAGNPRILVLDEATSALDNVSQAAVVANLDRLHVTRIVVAHRLSTIQRADRIAVLDGGRIVQQGTFADLVAVDGPFRTLVERQSVDALSTQAPTQ